MNRPDSDFEPQPQPLTSGRLTTFTAIAAVFAAMGLTAAESAFGSADAAARAAIQAAGDTPCRD